MNDRIVALDVRDDIRNGREPLSRILQAAAALQGGQELLVIAPFEPAPLYQVMSGRGFSHKASRTGAGDWQVLFSHATPVPACGPARSKDSAQPSDPAPPTRIVEVDARGLEPPQPLVRILETLTGLPPGAELRARTDRRPMHLFTQLEQRGFTGETEVQEDGSFLTHIRPVASSQC